MIEPITFTAQYDAATRHLDSSQWSLCYRIYHFVKEIFLFIPRLILEKHIRCNLLPGYGVKDPEATQAFDNYWYKQGNHPHFTAAPLELTSPTGTKLGGTLFTHRGAKGTDMPTIIVFNGNCEFHKNSDPVNSALSLPDDTPYNVISIDYPGCFDSEGCPDPCEITLAAATAYQFVRDHQGVNPDQIHYIGRSFGGAMVRMAQSLYPENGGKSVFVDTFSSVYDVIKVRFGWCLATIINFFFWLLDWTFPELENWDDSEKSLVMQVEGDGMIPPGSQLIESAEKAKKVTVPNELGCEGHLCPLSYRGDAIEEISTFLLK